MTAAELLLRSEEEKEQLNPRRYSPASPRQFELTTMAKKRPRTSSFSSSSSPKASRSIILPPNPPKHTFNNNSKSVVDELGLTRPPSPSWSGVSDPFRHQLPYIRGGGKTSNGGAKTAPPGSRSGRKYGRVGGAPGEEYDSEKGGKGDDAQLSKVARVMEQDRKKVASIRSFLLNFLEERDCSIKKRLDLYVHQTETGRPVTDAVVQEICKLRPDMIGISLRDCIEVTDVGMWCVARHAIALRELNVSGCQSVTNIGLRSLAICCPTMEQLDFTGCTRLTDLGLRVIAGGCWKLKSLSLERCAHVSDTGVAELAKLSTALTYLNISRCERVGEYGDRALIQLGRSCHQLKGLDAFGCSHAQDPGLLAVARGCPKLEKLMLTGCGGITGKSVRALARGCTVLQDLSLSGCNGVGNSDLKELAKGCTALRHLNIAECVQVNANGLAALASGLTNLTELDVGGCERVDDAALRALCSMNAQFLNLTRCSSITEAGVASIAKNCTALSSLNVTGCPSIGRRFMAELCHSMNLSEPAQEYFGFQPRKNAKELLARAVINNRRMRASVLLQALMRGRLARGRASIVKRNWIIKTRLARAQAYIRGYFARQWYRAWRAQVREQRAAAAIQATWRMLGDWRTAERLRAEKLFRERGHALATRIQAGWWGYRGRLRMKEIRAVRARRLLLEARVQTGRELSAIVIQNNCRRFSAQKKLCELRRLRDEALKLEQRRQAAAVLIQSFARMSTGRDALAVLKAERDRKILEWEMALRVQTAWHGKRARMVVLVMRIVKEQALQRKAAITIQSFWRAVRARHLTHIQRAMFKIRQMQGGASKDIQRMYRGFKGRLRAKARKRLFELELKREAAVMTIQRIYRGDKGREKFECKQHLQALENQARPLQLKLDELSENAVKISDRIRRVADGAPLLRAEAITLKEEIFHIRNTKDKYTDSNKVNNIQQRFLTKFLQVRLVELQTSVEARLDAFETEAGELEMKKRNNTRLLRQTERELLPLGMGTVEKAKLLRKARLRKKVRSEKSASTTIQRVFRGWRVRKAVNSWYRDYWIENEDIATGDVYYVNTWNQEVRWSKPLEMSLFEDERPKTGTSSKDSEGGGMDSISSRFSQRSKQLADEATKAAEEETALLRYIVATQGPDMLAAASEWNFVNTDSRLTTKCWYRSSTSEYYWGNEPPLLPVRGSTGAGSSGVGGDGGGDIGDGDTEVTQSLTFTDRAAGEAWLKTQDLTLLLVRAKKYRNIGPWQQLQAAPLSENECGSFSAETTGDSATTSNITTGSSTGLRAGIDRSPSRLENGSLQDRQIATSGARAGAEATVDGAASQSLPAFTFFYHPETGDVRWSLSPRSVLATPRTPRREASRARLAAQQQQQQQGVEQPINDELSLAVGRSLEGSDTEDGSWELVEDGDMVFYYNKRLGISSWEPPPEWDCNGGSFEGEGRGMVGG